MLGMIVSLWLLFPAADLTSGQEYEGCFQSSVTDPDLSLLILNHASVPMECIKECRSRYYMFAGLMNGQQCYCGSRYGRQGPSTACTIPCTMDPHSFCGTSEAMSIYSTGVKGPSPPRMIRTKALNPDELLITWQPPDISNGNVTSYTIHATALETHASNTLPSVESQVQGGDSNTTTIRGLQPGSKYNVSIIAINTRGESKAASVIAWTPIAPAIKPPTPQIIDQTPTTLTVILPRGSSENGPISSYQVLVVQPGTVPLTGSRDSFVNYETAAREGLGYYIAGEFDSADFPRYQKFVVGDGRMIGGYHNPPLNTRSVVPRIGVAVVSRLGADTLYSYSDLTGEKAAVADSSRVDAIAVALYVAIVIVGALLIGSIVLYFLLRRQHETIRMKRMPEAQELTLQGPMYEVDNLGYIPEDVPERINHYQELKRKVWSVPQENLEIDPAVVRRGRFGTVHRGTARKDEKVLQVAIHSIADGLLRASEKRNMLRELDVCIKVSPMQNVAGLVGTCETPNTLFVVLEMPPQTLKSKLLSARSGEIFPVDRILPIGTAVARALRHLEYHKIVHGRLCARSVGLCEDWTVKVMGHGIAKHALEDVKYARWTALESFSGQKKQQPAVVWAFGVLLWEMFSMGGTPYSSLRMESDVEEAVEKGTRLQQLTDLPDPIYEVMLSCWQVSPQERPTFDELTRLETLSICPITSITEPYVPELELD